MANNQENQTVTDGSQNAGQTVTANTGTVSTANSSITGPVIAAMTTANSVTPQSIIANAVTAEKLAANSVDETENGPDWKALSRKHEKQAKDNYEQLRKTEAAYEESQSQLHDLQVENARMKAQKAHPQISDDVFALCGETEPEKISEWAEKYAALNPVAAPTKSEPVREKAEQGHAPVAREPRRFVPAHTQTGTPPPRHVRSRGAKPAPPSNHKHSIERKSTWHTRMCAPLAS